MSRLWIPALLVVAFCFPVACSDTGDDDTSSPGDDDDATASDDDDTIADDDDHIADDDDSISDDDDNDTASDDDVADDDDDTTAPPTDFTVTGPYPVTSTSDTYNPSGFCYVSYSVFTPTGAPTAPTVVLTHGFSRTSSAFADLAAHIASWGLTVATPTMCHSTPLDSDPPLDAAEMIDFKAMIGATNVIWAGHSAGGLRSVLAANLDPQTVAVLGLDLTDGDDLAVDAAPSLTVPLNGLVGEAGMCNSDGNGVNVYLAAAGSNAVRVAEADHCDFEDPTDWMCTLLCEADNSQFTTDEVKATIRGMATAYLVWQAGLDASGEDWWTPGHPAYDSLAGSGAISAL
jgi:pimeloyl-ACP methyl ester carboxylesterase